MTKWLKMLSMLWSLTGCAAAIPALPLLSGLFPAPIGTEVLTTTQVNLSRQNFKIVKANAIGSSVGFSFLGLIPLKSPSYNEAITKLYQHAGVSEGKAQTLANVVHENNTTYFILFALSKITMRADVIEFTANTLPVNPITDNIH
jgi:TctA family transporter